MRRAPLLTACLLGLLPLRASAEEVTLFAAASLKTALETLEPVFEEATGADLRISLAGSSALARQIEQGAPADVYISANPDWMDLLEGEGLLAPGTRKDLLSNEITLVAPAGEAPEIDLMSHPELPKILGAAPLAMALVEAVPAGIYGKQALTSLGLWEAVAPHVAQADNVRAALSLVALGEAPLGIVYATDARAEPKVEVVATFPADSHDPILYPIAALAENRSPLTEELLVFLTGPEARATFEAQGFTWLGD
ncbi:molybdate transport system substrate-binding protein [Pseudooceanicola antarcticus]|uniref:Molybdate ABC transporter substrate-binding protein n=1 Tax=Pseudooceanicola antarcticus TaxID=1247613 RepID=A0A285J6I3_9RHOB|nr:molybdate ABC transporter substrate-binding protein [Pseudooceanicola antarcticus]PJE29648.1 molybdate ABC transporter substrate-binding protein [Pseudooceanicola antarcticus]SNY54966.1 molybdate transport system substrate-binding protein [Pseudooceanicola antarcticus]